MRASARRSEVSAQYNSVDLMSLLRGCHCPCLFAGSHVDRIGISVAQLILLSAANAGLVGATAVQAAAPQTMTGMERPDWAWEISNHGRECFDASVAHKPAGATGHPRLVN